jgi:hypothetical protein
MVIQLLHSSLFLHSARFGRGYFPECQRLISPSDDIEWPYFRYYFTTLLFCIFYVLFIVLIICHFLGQLYLMMLRQTQKTKLLKVDMLTYCLTFLHIIRIWYIPLFVYLFICLFIVVFVYLFVCLLCLFICLFVCCVCCVCLLCSFVLVVCVVRLFFIFVVIGFFNFCL